VKRHKVVLALVPALVLAGCLGGLTGETGPSDSTDVSPEQVPGVTNGTLSDASALVDANRNAVTTEGAILQVNQSSSQMNIDARLSVGANFSTYSLSGSGTVGADQFTTIDQWSNKTTQFVRTSSDEQTNYRVLDGHDDRLTVLSSMREFISAGNFEVANETAGDGMVVLTADSASAASSSMADLERFDGRLVVDESGQIQNFSVTLTRQGEQVSYSYELRQAGVESVSRPGWVEDVPPGATVQAQLSVDVENDSYLTLEHSRGDEVPSATTVRVESNGTTDTVSLDSSLSAGDTRYVYFDASSQELRATVDRPDASAVSPVTSPVSVRIATDGGAVLHSGSMAWDSATAHEAGDSSSGSSSSEASAGSSSGSTSSESMNETASE
jgi:hypothetical protein